MVFEQPHELYAPSLDEYGAFLSAAARYCRSYASSGCCSTLYTNCEDRFLFISSLPMKSNVSHSLTSCDDEPLPSILVGVDWGDSKHAFALRLSDGTIESGFVASTSEILHSWLETLLMRFDSQPIAFVLEAGSVPLIAALREYPQFRIYPVCPLASAAYRKSFRPSGAKDDQPDAQLLLQMLVVNHHQLIPIPNQGSVETRLLDKLVIHRRRLVDRRTALTNQLRSTLKAYFPQALQLLPDDLSRPFVALFLERFPSLLDLKKARSSTIRKVFTKGGYRSAEKIEAKIQLIQQARLLHKDHALTAAAELQVKHAIMEIKLLKRQISETETQVNQLFKNHENASFYRNLPGAGPAMAPRLLAAIELLPTQTVSEAQRYIGVAPVIERSGNQCWTHRRFHPPGFLHQTLVEWAGLTVQYSQWANAYYLHARAKGKKRYTILRALAFKWVRIILRCLETSQGYDEATHIKRLQQADVPWALPLLPQPSNT